MKSNRKTRLICLCLIILTVVACFSGCKARPLTPPDGALNIVGTVGGYDVTYEEFYFLARNYNSEDITAEELFDTVAENITANYAILSLCDEAGVTYDEDELEDAVDDYMKQMIDDDFGGSRKNYTSALSADHMTDHYVRFTVRTDLLYAKLATALVTNGEISANDSEITEYIKENFVRTWHVMIADESGAEQSAKDALSDLESGRATMHELIGSTLNDDLLIPGEGYAFARGSMDEKYEEAAFSLTVGEYSDVIKSRGELGTGEYVDCYYIIQRLPLDDEYIEKNFSTLCETYETSVVAGRLASRKTELEFVPNEYAKSLDIKNLPELGIGTDTYAIIGWIVGGVCAAGVTVGVVLLVRHLSRRKKAMIAEKKKRTLKAPDESNS